MANQAIALGIRAPQPIDLGAATARFGNMMANMSAMEKQKNDMARVNQLRSLLASGVDITTPEGFNQVASLDPQAAAALRKSAEETAAANRKREDDLVVKHRNEGVAVSSMGQFEGWLNGLEADDPKSAAQFRQFMGPTFDQAKMDRIISTADQYINKNIPTARTDVQLDEQGNPGVVYSGGYDPARIVRPKTFGYGNVPAPAAAAPQGQAAPIAPEEAERFIASFPAAAQPAIRERVMRGDLGNIPMGNPAPSAGGRGGMGGPYEAIDQMPVRASSTQNGTVSNLGPQGLVETTPFRARVPAPPQGPQPRETAGEVYAKEQARLKAQRENALLPQPVKPLTPVQDAKLRANITTDYKAAKATIDQMTDPKIGLTAAVDAVHNLSRPQKISLTGYSNYLPSITSGAKAADVAYANLVGKITEMGKTLASLGGAIGPMAVQEWGIVRQMVAETDPVKMDPDTLDNQLELIRATAIGAAQRIKDAYENQYIEEFARYPGRFQLGNLSAAPAAAPAKSGQKYPTFTPEQARKAPKGTRYRTTDGRILER
jgi:hypothetical protein